MTLPNETIHTGASNICNCGTPFELEVLMSNAGYYIGTICNTRECPEKGIPNSRESGYYRNRKEAQTALAANRKLEATVKRLSKATNKKRLG